MEIKLIGLGKMGLNLAKNLISNGFLVHCYDQDKQARQQATNQGIKTYDSLTSLIKASDHQIYYLMVPANEAIIDLCQQLNKLAPKGAYIIDGGNTHFAQSQKHYQMFKANNQHFIDVGSSGGQEAAEHGLCLMVGGTNEAVEHLKPIFEKIALPNGYQHVGPPGAGHYVKMIHNGIEYGMMQALAEGLDVLSHSQDYPNLKLGQITHVWEHGSVIRSWLVELATQIFRENPNLEGIGDLVNSSGEGLWTIIEALKLAIPVPVLSASIHQRHRSLQTKSTAGQILNALRHKFGGHKLN